MAETFRLDQINGIKPVAGEEGESTGKYLSLADAMSMDPIDEDHSEFNENGFLDLKPERVAQIKAMGKIGFIEAAQRQDKTEMLPFNPEAAVKVYKLKLAVDRIRNDKYEGIEGQKAQDLNLINGYLESKEEERIREYTIMGSIAKGVAQLPGFMTEFLATGGAASIAKKSVEKSAQKMIGKAVERGVMKFSTKVVGAGAGAVARTALMPHRVAEKAFNRELNASFNVTEKGLEVAKEAKERPFTAWAKSFGDVAIENFSEVTGPGIGLVGGKIAQSVVPKQFMNAITKVFQKLHPNESITKLFTKLGYNGFLEELGEERVGDILRAITGVEDFGSDGNVFDRIVASIPTGEQLLIEAGVLTVPGVTNVAISRMFQKAPKPKVVLSEISDEVAQDIANKANEESSDEVSRETMGDPLESAIKKIDSISQQLLLQEFSEEQGKDLQALGFEKMLENIEDFTPEEVNALQTYFADALPIDESGNIDEMNMLQAVRDIVVERGNPEEIKKIDQLIEKAQSKQASSQVEIPDFKNTEEAIAFGLENKDRPEVLEALKAKRAEIQARTKELMDKENATPEEEREAFLLAQKGQFPREALEAAEKAKEKKVDVKKEEIPKPGEESQTNKIPQEEVVNQMEVGGTKSSKTKAQIRKATGQVKDQGENISERKAFIQSLKDRVKAASESRKSTREEIFDMQNAIVDLVKNSELEANDKSKFLKLVKNIQTQDEFKKAFPEIIKRIDRLEKAEAKRSIIGEIKKVVARARKSNSISIDFVNTIEDLVDEVDLSNRKPETIERLNRSAEYFKNQIAQGKEVDIPKALLKKMRLLDKNALEDLSVDELSSLLEQVNNLVQQGETKLRIREEMLQKRKEKDLEAVKDSKPLSMKETKKANIGERLSVVDNFKNSITEQLNMVQQKSIAINPMDVVFDILDGVKNYGGGNFNVFKKPFDEVWSNFLERKDKLIRPVVDLANDLKLKTENFERIGVHAAREQEGGRQKIADTLFPDLSKQAAKLEKQKKTREADEIRAKIDQQIDAIELSPDEIKLYNAMRNVFDSLAPEIEEIMRVVYNQPFESVKNYFSFMTDFEAMSDFEIRDRFGDNIEELGKALKKNVQKGFTITRKLGRQKIKLNAMEIFLRHTENATYLVEAGPTIKYLGELAATEEYGESVGDFGQQVVREWIDLLARKGGVVGDRIIFLDTLRKNVGLATLGFKLSSALLQPTAIFNGAALIGDKAFSGAHNIATNREWREFVMNNFQEIKQRGGDDLAFLDFGGSTVIDKTGRASMWALQKLDLITAASVAAGAYEKAVLDKGGTVDLSNPDKEAITEAQRIVRRTQSSAFFKDSPSALTQGNLTGNVSVDRLILQFQSFMLNEWSLIQHDLYRSGIIQKNYAQAVNIAAWLMLSQFAQLYTRRMSKELIAFMTGDDLDEWPETFKKEMVLAMLDKIPFVSQIASAVGYGSIPVPAIDMSKRIAERFNAALTAKKQTTKTRNFIRGIILLLGAGFGVSGTVQADQITRNLLDDKKVKVIK